MTTTMLTLSYERRYNAYLVNSSLNRLIRLNFDGIFRKMAEDDVALERYDAWRGAWERGIWWLKRRGAAVVVGVLVMLSA